jgi:ribonuclease HI
MDNTLKILQLNVRKQSPVQYSLMNDETLRDFAVLAIAEPHAFMMGDELFTSPMGHSNWTKFTPSTIREGRWPIRSMIWIRSDLESAQVPINSPDLTAVVLTLPDRKILIISVYIPHHDQEALTQELRHIEGTIQRTRVRYASRLDLLVLGDFNRHDQLWGGNNVSAERQGEADGIIEMMTTHSLQQLLRRGTPTWQRGELKTTIDLTLASNELTQELIKCKVHGTEHGSDHRAIETTFDISAPIRPETVRYLYKNAPWNDIRKALETELDKKPCVGSTQHLTDFLTDTVTKIVTTLTPKAKPSPYAKRWWTQDLSLLRQAYTHWRNRAKSARRWGVREMELEKMAKEASKEYHDALRKQRKTHWQDFVAETDNIWQVSKYIKPRKTSAFEKIPPLTRADGTETSSKREQAEELLESFFPPLPARIEDEPLRTQRTPLHSPEITMEEVERAIFKSNPWKAPGADGIPAMVWRQVWPVASKWIYHIFKCSLQEGVIPQQWRNARIIPLRKLGKPDYTVAKAYRPISLLSTLGKALEALVAERISYMVEKESLLPPNHFGARKQRSTEHALTMIQEYAYKAWRSKKILSLISFDVKGAYNGVCKERLLQRLVERGVPPGLVQWVNAFCSERTADIIVNGEVSASKLLTQAGLPQGSPLSPILFLFFNANLVEQKTSNNGGAVAFVDDYTVWVTGESVTQNNVTIQALVEKALEWEKCSGATFEPDKTAFIHFTRTAHRANDQPIRVKDKMITPQSEVKILGVIMDTELRYKTHLARTATRGLAAAMALKRLKVMSPATARQLFAATVAPVMDYASNIWHHACTQGPTAPLIRAQRIGAQAVTGAFRTVSTAIAEAEACVRTIEERHRKKAVSFYANLQCVSSNHPARKLLTRVFRRFTSPLQRIIQSASDITIAKAETVVPYAIAPWHDRMTVKIDEESIETVRLQYDVAIGISSSMRKGRISVGIAIRQTGSPSTIRLPMAPLHDEDHTVFTAELKGIQTALYHARRWPGKAVQILTHSKAVLQAIHNPQQQSGQHSIGEIYANSRVLERAGGSVAGQWARTANEQQELMSIAKAVAKEGTRDTAPVPTRSTQAKSRLLDTIIRTLSSKRKNLPKDVGKFTREMDRALPGSHTKTLYNMLTHEEAAILAQLRTGMSRLNAYLSKIQAVDSALCVCGTAKETVKHFLFRCCQWDTIRKKWEPAERNKRGNISWALGGKESADAEDKWEPNTDAVMKTVRFAMETKRLRYNPEDN